ncbi:MAG: YdeI/OmpD-associated family protein [Bacteroidota bacterium]
MELTEELITCFDNEPPEVRTFYNSLTQDEQKSHLDWIYDAKTDDTKTKRILEMMDKLALGKRFYD